MTQPTTEFDTPWKDILETYFEDFMSFFFPQAYRQIDWSKGFEFLDKELQQIMRDAELGKRLVDKLVKIYRKEGEEAWVLIHLEIQSQSEIDFAERMYVYNYRIYDRYRRKVASLAILGDKTVNWRPEQFSYELFGCHVSLRFPSVKLLDLNQQWSELEASRNPFAMVTMAHLKTLETKKDKRRRKEWKLSLIKRLYEQGYARRDIINLLRFINWVMKLPEALAQEFEQQVNQYEEARRMPYVLYSERLKINRGQASLLLRQLKRKFGELTPEIEAQIQKLSSLQLEDLSDALLDFQQIEELTTWLSSHPPLPETQYLKSPYEDEDDDESVPEEENESL